MKSHGTKRIREKEDASVAMGEECYGLFLFFKPIAVMKQHKKVPQNRDWKALPDGLL